MLLLGIDVGTSSIKASVVNAGTGRIIASSQYPDSESPISSPKPGWAEQSPEMWWQHVQEAIRRTQTAGAYDPAQVATIGIAYQMHGLVMLDKKETVLRPSIIWCDSRAVSIGEEALQKIGKKKALSRLLNSPGNFTASKLAWVKAKEPKIYRQAAKVMLPGDYISLKLTGQLTTSISALSEGIFWDFSKDRLSEDVLDCFGFDKKLLPAPQPVFSIHGRLLPEVAEKLSLPAGIPVSYKAGDQPNNALSLNVLEPGEVAATAGTSGVIYGVSDDLRYDKLSRVNSFAHVNYQPDRKRIGILLCINGTGILNRWLRDELSGGMSYPEMNEVAATVPVGSAGLRVLPFGNGAERMLNNQLPGASIQGLDLNLHGKAHLFRAAQEGIACAFRYGLDIMRENGMRPKVIRAGLANLFLSELFVESFVNITRVPVELYHSDGSVGAALGAGIGAGLFKSPKEAFRHMKPVRLVKPATGKKYEHLYQSWKETLEKQLSGK